MSDAPVTNVPTATLRRWLRRVLDQDMHLRLYVNKDRPSAQSTVDDFDELSGHGYEPIILLPIAWKVEDDRPAASAPQQVWVLKAGDKTDVYGYYLTEREGSALCWAAHFVDGPYPVEVAYDQIKVTPKILWRV